MLHMLQYVINYVRMVYVICELNKFSSAVVCRSFGLLSDDELNYVLPLFIAEVVKKDGSVFPPATL